MKKKVLSMFLASIFCLCGLGMLAGCGAETPDDGYQSPFYTLEEAYAQGFLSAEDVEEVSSFSSSKIFEGLTPELSTKIQEALRAEYVHQNPNETAANAEEFKFHYYGAYGKGYVIKATNYSTEDSKFSRIFYKINVTDPWQDYNAQAQSGFYTLEEAYEQGVLLPSDLETVSQYLSGYEPYPEELTDDELKVLQEALKERFLHTYSQEEIEQIESDYGIDAEDFRIFYYAGKYNGAYIFTHTTPYFGYPTDMNFVSCKIGNVNFRYEYTSGRDCYVYKAY